MVSFQLSGKRRQWLRPLISLAIIAALVGMSLGSGLWRVVPAAAAPDALVRCDPANPSTAYDTDVAVDIYVEDAVDLYAADAQLTFDTSLAQVVDMLPAGGVQIGALSTFMVPGFIARQSADNTTGAIWYAATQTNPSPPVSGSGPLARVTFHPLTYGSFTLAFSSTQLSTREGLNITATAQSCLVNFLAPLPSTTGISPDNALANSAAFSLTVSGTNFVNGSGVQWGGALRPTTYVSSTQLLASIPASDLTVAGPVSVTVLNPLPGGGTSNPQTFTVNTRAHFSAAAYNAGEAAGSASLPVVLDAPSTLTVTVGVTSSNGTATLADYGTVSETLTFAPGVVTQTVNVAITPDALDEADETVNLALGPATNVALSSPSTATLTILDDDNTPTVQFASSAYTVTESAGSAPVDVVLSAPSGLTVTVVYSTSNQTAQGGQDFTPVSATLSIPPGEISAEFDVTITNDANDELDETLGLTLSAPGNATLGAPASASLTILDEDAASTVQFQQASFTVSEGTATAVITVTLNVPAALTVTVSYTTANGTAMAGSDYLTSTGVLTFTPGQTTAFFSVSVLSDTVDEPDETVLLGLGPPANAILGVPANAILTLLDDDLLFRLLLPTWLRN